MIDEAIGKDCCGCKMCGDACPSGAISFATDAEGFWYPRADAGKCSRCGVCVGKCPVLNETEDPAAFSPDVYCAWILDDGVRVRSTSGGLYYALAKRMLEDGGYIAGCAFSDDWKSARHVVGNTYGDLERIYRSKYFQSDTEGIYAEAGRLLGAGERLLFCGTPCQSAALLEYLGRDCENLVRCDFVCRGINSPAAHRANVRELERRHGSEVEFFNFKNKSKGWTRLGLLVRFKNGEVDFTDRDTCAWTKGYINYNLYMRPSCEKCRFKRIPRVSDISIGDFWGLEGSREDMEKGMSLVMVNTQKGRDFYERTLGYLHSEPQTLERALAGNACILNCPSVDHEKRGEFFRRMEAEDFSRLVGRLNRGAEARRRVRAALSRARRAASRVAPGLFRGGEV